MTSVTHSISHVTWTAGPGWQGLPTPCPVSPLHQLLLLLMLLMLMLQAKSVGARLAGSGASGAGGLLGLSTMTAPGVAWLWGVLAAAFLVVVIARVPE